MNEYPYIWAWGKVPTQGNYKGLPCRVLERGAKNTALIEFENGEMFIMSRSGLRKRKGADKGDKEI